MSSEKEKRPAPDIVLTDGALRSASWREDGKYGPFYNTKITRRYENAVGEGRETSSMRERDLLAVAALATETHGEILSRKRERSQDVSQDQAERGMQSEDWHDDAQSRKEIRRQRFKEERQSRGTRRTRQRDPGDEY